VVDDLAVVAAVIVEIQGKTILFHHYLLNLSNQAAEGFLIRHNCWID
jgi:hypothetical protein